MGSIKISLEGLPQVQKKLKDYALKVEKETIGALNAFGTNTVKDAKLLAPVNESKLRSSISFVPATTGKLEVEIIVGTNYAAFIEFGTKQFAAKYVSSLPQDWQVFAAEYKNPGEGTFEEMVKRLTEWVHHKGLGTAQPGRGSIGVAGSYSVKTKRRIGNRKKQDEEDKAAAYMIARSILRKGMKSHPFLYPAVYKNKPLLIENLKSLLR